MYPQFSVRCWLVVVCAVTAARGATTLSSLPTGTSSVSSAADVGQSFVVPAQDHYLTGYSAYFFSSGTPVTYSTALYPFNASTFRITGPAVYSGPAQTAPVIGTWPPVPASTFTFSTPLFLQPGAGYLFVVDQQDYSSSGNNLQFTSTDSFGGGELYLSVAKSPYASSSWQRDPFDSSASTGFSATFAAASDVPEPAGIGLILVAASAALIGRRQRNDERAVQDS